LPLHPLTKQKRKKTRKKQNKKIKLGHDCDDRCGNIIGAVLVIDLIDSEYISVSLSQCSDEYLQEFVLIFYVHFERESST